MKIFISLPMEEDETGYTRRKADGMMAALSRLGHTAVNPLDICAGKDPDYFDRLIAELRELAGCDAIMMCRGWQHSKACCIERSFAEIYMKKILFETSHMPDNEH